MGNSCCGLNESEDEAYGDLNTDSRERNSRKQERERKQNERERKQNERERKQNKRERIQRKAENRNSRNYHPLDPQSFVNESFPSHRDRFLPVSHPVQDPIIRKVNIVAPNRILQAKNVRPTTKTNCNPEEYERKLHEFQKCQNYRTWQDEDVVSQVTKVPTYIVKNVISLLNDGATVPFISRYRRDKIVNIPVENVQEVQLAYTNVKKVHQRVNNIWKILAKENIETNWSFLVALVNAKTLEEVEFLYAPFNPENQISFIEAIDPLWFENLANDILKGTIAFSPYNLLMLIKCKTTVAISEDELTVTLLLVIGNIVSKNQTLLDFIHNHSEKRNIEISTCHSNEATTNPTKLGEKVLENDKFEHYYNFRSIISNLMAHQILAINRGEAQNILIVRVKVPEQMKDKVLNKCWLLFCHGKSMDPETSDYLILCFKEAYDRVIEPELIKQVRNELTNNAIKESMKVFCTNLKRLLLTPPIRGENIIALDPGFKHGCKVAVVACNGTVLQTDVMFPTNAVKRTAAGKMLLNMVSSYNATIIALGNGTACRETELWLSNLINQPAFKRFKIRYCIVDENGASVYSVSEEGEKDLPGMDPKLRSAVSIARRLQDPLSEYVKIDPKHLGVGMYQHDMPEEMLKEALETVVVECVSFVGVDLNVCSEALLRKVSGLSAILAKQIILWRKRNGCFINRMQLLEVKNFTQKCYEQCAGFVKILPSTCLKSKSCSPTKYIPNLLDATPIHPESYGWISSFLLELKSYTHEVGTNILVKKIIRYTHHNGITHIAKKFNVSPEKFQFVLDVLMRPLEYDIRQEYDKPLFKTGIRSINDLTTTNEVLTGRVVNVIPRLGAFVDIGVGKDGLIHASKMWGRHIQLGDTVSVIVLSVDVTKQKISLKLQDIL